jgi:hypothetical protein
MSHVLKSMFVALAMACAAPAVAQTHAEPAPSTSGPPAITADAWRPDLDFLVSKIEAMHPNPFLRLDKTAFDAEVAKLNADLPGLTRDEAVVRIMEITASLGDGHTSVPLEALRRYGDHVLPLRFYLYPDGLRLQAADRRYAQALGGRLVAIGTMPAAEAAERMSRVASHDNAITAEGRMPAYLMVPELLAGIGAIRDPHAPVPVDLEVKGRRMRLTVDPVVMPPQEQAAEDDRVFTSDWVDSRPDAQRLPLWQQHRDKAYWFTFEPGSQTLYVQYNQSTSADDDPMPAFGRRLRGEIAARAPKRVVLDLRRNSGGESYWNKSLFLALIKSDEIDQKGRLFVLIGRQSFSAGSLLAIELEKYSNAVFIGEPTGGGVQNFGNHEHVELPNSRLGVMIATRYYQNTPFGTDRPWIAPQIAADLTQADYEAGRDPALEASIGYVDPGRRLLEALSAVPSTGAGEAFKHFAAEPAYRYLGMEGVLLQAGYELLRAKDYDRAIAAMTLAAGLAHPTANAFDSLGDAYLAAGRRDEAIAAYRRALAINPGWFPSRQSLQKLGVAP